MFIINALKDFGAYLRLMGRVFSRPERMRMFSSSTLKRCTPWASAR